jgi:hypothetical protein
MTTMTIKLRAIKRRKGEPIPELTYDMPSGFDPMSAAFGEETIVALFAQAARQQLSEWARKLLTRKKDPLTVAAVQGMLDCGEWKPSVKRRGKTAAEKIEALLSEMPPTEREEFRRRMRGEQDFVEVGRAVTLLMNNDSKSDPTIAKFAPEKKD